MNNSIELTDAIWIILGPIFSKGARAQNYTPLRKSVNGILWKIHNEARWDEIPPEYGGWMTAYRRYHNWLSNGAIAKATRISGISFYVPDLPPKPRKPSQAFIHSRFQLKTGKSNSRQVNSLDAKRKKLN